MPWNWLGSWISSCIFSEVALPKSMGCTVSGSGTFFDGPTSSRAGSRTCSRGTGRSRSCWRRVGSSREGDWVLRVFQQTAAKAGIGKLGTHSLRHSYRSWLDAVGTAIAVQQKLMRHSDIRTTLNIYGDVVTDEMAQAHSKVVELALPRKVIAN